jgi:hypothetical protein
MTPQELKPLLEQAAMNGAAIALEMAGVYRKQTEAANAIGVTRKTIGAWAKKSHIKKRGTKVSMGDVAQQAAKRKAGKA